MHTCIFQVDKKSIPFTGNKDIYKNQAVQIQTKDKHLGIQSEHWLFQYSYTEWRECITLPIYFDKYWPRILLMCSQIWCKQKWTWWHDDIPNMGIPKQKLTWWQWQWWYIKVMMTIYGHTWNTSTSPCWITFEQAWL